MQGHKNYIDPESTQGSVAWMAFRTLSAKVSRNRYVSYLNRNDAKRNLNLNNWQNDWSDDWGFLGAQQSRFLPRLFLGEFLYRLPPPATKHSTDPKKRLRKVAILSFVKRFHFPRKLQ